MERLNLLLCIKFEKEGMPLFSIFIEKRSLKREFLYFPLEKKKRYLFILLKATVIMPKVMQTVP